MIVFVLTMPGRGSWNGKWTGEGRIYARVREERHVPKEIVGRSFSYCWDDGWEACVEVYKVPAAEAKKIEKKSVGFSGYDWMIDSIVRDGYIHTMEEAKAK